MLFNWRIHRVTLTRKGAKKVRRRRKSTEVGTAALVGSKRGLQEEAMGYARWGGATKSIGDVRKWEKGSGRNLLATSPPLAKQNPAGTCPITTPLKHEGEALTGYCRHYWVVVVSA
jgi:hypothetical protein